VLQFATEWGIVYEYEEEHNMTTAVRLPVEIIEDTRKNGKLHYRSAPKQIEYWYRLGKIAEENPDLPMDFIKDAIEGLGAINMSTQAPFVTPAILFRI
jgi:hypothetical protein